MTSQELEMQAGMFRRFVKRGAAPLLSTLAAVADGLSFHSQRVKRLEESQAVLAALSWKLQNTATTLAAMLDEGEFGSASTDNRFHLRCLSCDLQSWGLEAAGVPLDEAPQLFRRPLPLFIISNADMEHRL